MRFTESLVATSGPTKNAQKLLTAYVHFEQLTIQLRGYLRVTCNSGEGEYQGRFGELPLQPDRLCNRGELRLHPTKQDSWYFLLWAFSFRTIDFKAKIPGYKA